MPETTTLKPTPLPPLTPAEEARWMAEFRMAWKRIGGADWEARAERERREWAKWGKSNG